jgi:uncharacterized RDD family membrane protein YckC
LVPEATPERIARAEALLAEQPELLEQTSSANRFDEPLSDAEIDRLAREQSYLPLDQMDFSGYPTASLVARFLAATVDQFIMVMAVVGGFLLVMMMAKNGMAENPIEAYRLNGELKFSTMVLIYCLPVMFVLIQWVLLATSGQTVGKKLLMIRIVTVDGRLPGIVQSVILRNWVRNLLYIIPLAWLVDCLFLLGDSKRAGHDWIAGTKVIANV